MPPFEDTTSCLTHMQHMNPVVIEPAGLGNQNSFEVSFLGPSLNDRNESSNQKELSQANTVDKAAIPSQFLKVDEVFLEL